MKIGLKLILVISMVNLVGIGGLTIAAMLFASSEISEPADLDTELSKVGTDRSSHMTQAAAAINEMAFGADQINVAVNEVNELAGINHEKVRALMKEASRFKVA